MGVILEEIQYTMFKKLFCIIVIVFQFQPAQDEPLYLKMRTFMYGDIMLDGMNYLSQ